MARGASCRERGEEGKKKKKEKEKEVEFGGGFWWNLKIGLMKLMVKEGGGSVGVVVVELEDKKVVERW